MFLPAFSLFAFVLGLPIASCISVDSFSNVCQQLAKEISSASDIYYPGNSSYTKDILHWAASSSQMPACVFEPGIADDIASVLKVLGATKTPFAVQGGGHASNPTFSSTIGVHISMKRFSQVEPDMASNTATIGAGLIWDDVYAALDPIGVTVLGGRVSGIGVAGLALGGGYSWQTNQHGLTLDTIRAYELVLPNGTVANVTENRYPDLFFALRGGGNNFGVVTRFTLQTYEQGLIWGGQIAYDGNQFDKFNAAIVNFLAQVTDPKAQILPSYYASGNVSGISGFFFYGGPTPPQGMFDEFLAIPNLLVDLKTRSYTSLITSFAYGAYTNKRLFFHTVAVRKWTPALLDAITQETKSWGFNLTQGGNTTVIYGIEPFLFTHLTHSKSSAYPPNWARNPSVSTDPMALYFSWDLESADQVMHDAITASANYLQSLVVKEEGAEFEHAPLYPNYAIYSTPVESLYGVNLPRLKQVAQKYDPEGVMKLAGGFKL